MTTLYYFDSLAPTWLAADTGYRAALAQHLLDRMALQGYEVAGETVIGYAAGDVAPPVGTALLRVEVMVEEFDIDMGDGGAPTWGRLAPLVGERYVADDVS